MSQSLACCRHVSPICRSIIHRFMIRFNRGAAQSGVTRTLHTARISGRSWVLPPSHTRLCRGNWGWQSSSSCITQVLTSPATEKRYDNRRNDYGIPTNYLRQSLEANSFQSDSNYMLQLTRFLASWASSCSRYGVDAARSELPCKRYIYFKNIYFVGNFFIDSVMVEVS